MTALYQVIDPEFGEKVSEYIELLSSGKGIDVVRDETGASGFIFKQASYRVSSIATVGMLETLAYPLRCFVIYLAMLDAAEISDGKGVDKNSTYRAITRENLKYWLQGDSDPDLLTAMESIVDEHFGFIDFQFY